jgi:hypothetical protein
VVSWNDAAEIHDSVPSDALVIPRSIETAALYLFLWSYNLPNSDILHKFFIFLIYIV